MTNTEHKIPNTKHQTPNAKHDPPLTSVFAKDRVTVIVTDSGLGGIAIFAQIAARLKHDPIFSNVTLIYYNAWPEQNRGYNGFKDMGERIQVFDSALKGMLRYQPDIILIACNTLSVLYDQTRFSRQTPIPVIDIVRFGVDLVYEKLFQKPNAAAILLGTVTTITSNVHRSALIRKGISADCLIPQPCDQLATQIEKGPGSDIVKQMVDRFMDQAIQKITLLPSEAYAALFCTHFGYIKDYIKQSLEVRLHKPVTVLDPNQFLAGILFDTCDRRYERSHLNLQVVSRIIWDQTKIDAVANIIETRSIETAEALRAYERIPELFTISHIEPEGLL